MKIDTFLFRLVYVYKFWLEGVFLPVIGGVGAIGKLQYCRQGQNAQK